MNKVCCFGCQSTTWKWYYSATMTCSDCSICEACHERGGHTEECPIHTVER